MNKQQLIIVFVSVAIVLTIFSLPKVLLNKEEKELENSATLENEQPKTPKKEHGSVSFSSSDKFKSERLKNKLLTAEYSNSIILLDSLSIIYNNKGLYDSTAFYYERTLAKYDNAAGFVAIGDATYKAYYFATDDERSAEWALKTQQYYQKVLAKDPSMLDVKARMAMTYTKGKNPMKAVLTLREVLEKDPENEQALLNIGLLSVQSGQFEKAIERFKKLLSVNKSNWLGTFYLGIAYNETGKKELAKECFAKVIANEKEVQVKEAAEQYLKQLSINP
ncbi:MAG: tetratricopeptide repeat protein [Opitutaceae bacterium]|nr:tetratricopeptide repeat protein [Cytophagales bacterium]